MKNENLAFLKHLVFYLFSGIGYLLIVIGVIIFFYNVFTIMPFSVDRGNNYYQNPIEEAYYGSDSYMGKTIPVETAREISSDSEQKIDIDSLISKAQEISANRIKEEKDDMLEERNANFSISLSLILVGIPLYLFHWMYIRKNFLGR